MLTLVWIFLPMVSVIVGHLLVYGSIMVIRWYREERPLRTGQLVTFRTSFMEEFLPERSGHVVGCQYPLLDPNDPTLGEHETYRYVSMNDSGMVIQVEEQDEDYRYHVLVNNQVVEFFPRQLCRA